MQIWLPRGCVNTNQFQPNLVGVTQNKRQEETRVFIVTAANFWTLWLGKILNPNLVPQPKTTMTATVMKTSQPFKFIRTRILQIFVEEGLVLWHVGLWPAYLCPISEQQLESQGRCFQSCFLLRHAEKAGKASATSCECILGKAMEAPTTVWENLLGLLPLVSI